MRWIQAMSGFGAVNRSLNAIGTPTQSMIVPLSVPNSAQEAAGTLDAPRTGDARQRAQCGRPRAQWPLVHCTHDAITHQPAAIDHDRLHVTALPLVHKAGDDAQQRYQVRLAEIDHDQVSFIPRCEPASIWHAEGLIAVPRGPQ